MNTVACKLQPKDLTRRRTEILESLATKVRSFAETENSYLFLFQAQSDSLRELFAFVEFERKCCPFLEFQVGVPPAESDFTLKISTKGGGGEFIKGEIRALFPEGET